MLSIPKVDRSVTDPPNLVCVILHEKTYEVYEVGCRQGVIKGWFGHEQLKIAGSNFLQIDNVD